MSTSGEVRFANPLSSGGAATGNDDASTSPRLGKGPAKPLQKLANVGASLDIEQKLASSLSIVGRKPSSDDGPVPKPDPKVTEEQLRAAFEKTDKDGSGELDKAEVGLAAAELGASWSTEQLQEVVNLMDDDGNSNGFVDFKEFASFWLGKDWWLSSPNFKDEDEEEDGNAKPMAGARTGIGRTCSKLGSFLREKEASLHSGKKKRAASRTRVSLRYVGGRCELGP
eukprot:COSAG02_NODE_637_length_19192_cov_12.648405_10_plen_226_part_00